MESHMLPNPETLTRQILARLDFLLLQYLDCIPVGPDTHKPSEVLNLGLDSFSTPDTVIEFPGFPSLFDATFESTQARTMGLW